MMIDAFWMQTKMKLEWVFHEFAFFWQNFLSKHPISITNGCEDSCLINLCSRRVSYIHTCMWQYSLDTQWYSRRILSFLWDRLTRNTCWEHYLGCPKFWGNRFHNLHVFFFFNVWILSWHEPVIYVGTTWMIYSITELLQATSGFSI